MPPRMIVAMLVALSLLTACAQKSWKDYNDAGLEAHEQGRYAEAEELYLAALEKAEKFGDENAALSLILTNLAGLYHTQGKYAEAEPLFQRSLAIEEKALGSEHPNVAAVLNNLAALYDTQGKYAEAELLYQRSLAIREKTLGPDHPKVAGPLNNLAIVAKRSGDDETAHRLYERLGYVRGTETADYVDRVPSRWNQPGSFDHERRRTGGSRRHGKKAARPSRGGRSEETSVPVQSLEKKQLPLCLHRIRVKDQIVHT